MKAPFNTSPNDQELKLYLYRELPEQDIEELEGKLFHDDKLFFEAMALEDELVDRYVQDELSDDEKVRFERALPIVPGRHQKIANAITLHKQIRDKRTGDVHKQSHAESIWQQIASFFRFPNSAVGYGMAGIFIVLALLSALLLIDNRRTARELAALQLTAASIEQMQKDLSDHRAREEELQGQIDEERDTSGDLGEELRREKELRIETEAKLARLQKDHPTGSRGQLDPVIASFLLVPVGGRKGSAEATNVSIGSSVKRLVFQLPVPESVKPDDRVSVFLNSRAIARNAGVRTSANGQNQVHASVRASDLSEGSNSISVIDSIGNEIGEYSFDVRKQQ